MRKIVYFVLSIHLSAVLWMALWMPVVKEKKKNLQVRTVFQAPPLVTQSATQAIFTKVQQPPPPKKNPNPQQTPPLAKKTEPKLKKTSSSPLHQIQPVIKKTQALSYLVQELEERIAKIEKKEDLVSTSPLQIAECIPALQPSSLHQKNKESFQEMLVDCLQNSLQLPEIGEVKMTLTLTETGHCVKIEILQSASELNSRFLEQKLKNFKFPEFHGAVKEARLQTYTITFCNKT